MIRSKIAAFFALVGLSACGGGELRHDGYLEADLVLVGAEQSGRVQELAIAEGDEIEAGVVIGVIDNAASRAEVAAAEARLEQARARLADARAAQQRPAEIDALQASLQSAEVERANAQKYVNRIEPLRASGAVTEVEYDNAVAARDRARAQVSEISNRIEAARQSAREGQVDAAQGAVAEAEASLARARTALERFAVISPAEGRVEEVYYRPGEVVMVGQPVIAMLPPGNLKVRFFVPEARLSSLSTGDRVTVSCDGCPAGLIATVSFIAREAEFTPPVILSQDQREKLVFMIEARPDEVLARLPAGQPVSVSLSQ